MAVEPGRSAWPLWSSSSTPGRGERPLASACRVAALAWAAPPPHILSMWKLTAIAGLALAAASPAAAQCISIPDGLGNAAVHCSDGRIGHTHTDAGGAVSGMLGGQALAGPLDPTMPGLAGDRPVISYVNPDLSHAHLRRVPPPPLAPPPRRRCGGAAVLGLSRSRNGAGLRLQPGEGRTIAMSTPPKTHPLLHRRGGGRLPHHDPGRRRRRLELAATEGDLDGIIDELDAVLGEFSDGE